MFFSIDSFALIGVEAIKVSVEVHISNGLPSFTIVGLPDKAVNESRQRVRAAIINSGFKFPIKRIIVNLSPAGIRKEGAFYDLPIALSILAVSGQIECRCFNLCSFIGELSLDGKVNPVKGIISMTEKAKYIGKKYFLVPEKVAHQASVINGVNIVACKNLIETIEAVSSEENLKESIFEDSQKSNMPLGNSYGFDFSDVKGQLKVKRALEIAVSGMHNILMVGPPGAGKTMLAQRVVTIMPDLNISECIEVTKIYSIYQNYEGSLIKKRPFRNPHHTITRAGLIGGGKTPRPGELSLSHRGVLFLDEFSQFPRNLIEDLRQPLENKKITITRSNISYSYPCSFILILAINPCPCGFFGEDENKCTCSEREIKKFWRSFSGPILDRVDMRVNVARLNHDEFIKDGLIENSKSIKKRVEKCMLIQRERYRNSKISYNSEADSRTVNDWIKKDEKIKNILKDISAKYSFTTRGVVSILKVARTIADLEDCQKVESSHVLEAIQYRLSYNLYNHIN